VSHLAWFTPWPPDRSGVAGRSAELIPRLAAAGHAIDVFVDGTRRDPSLRRVPAAAPAPGDARLIDAHDFVWRHARAPYDLVVYQVGNSEWHEFLWPYLFRWPGLAVLHDARVHHARGRALLMRGRTGDYRDEFAWCHPSVLPAAAELGVLGFNGPYYYQWPMIRTVVEASRLIAAHSRGAVAEVASAHPERTVEYIALGEGTPLAVDDRARRHWRESLGWPSSAVVFGVFGGLTLEKRVPQIVRAFASALVRNPDARLLLAGTLDPQVELDELLRELDLGNVVIRMDPLDDAAFDRAIAAVDVSLNLRWPTTLETSGPWLRALAASRATVIMDLAHATHLPTLDPRTWRRHAPSTGADDEAVAVGIDVLDEDHSLRLAFARLAVDGTLRESLGRRGHAHWLAEHTVDRMVAEYERVIARALATPVPARWLPPHLRPDPLAHAERLVAVFDVDLGLRR
jgi:glycosyltransferase involved in cell wall biosynthesis